MPAGKAPEKLAAMRATAGGGRGRKPSDAERLGDLDKDEQVFCRAIINDAKTPTAAAREAGFKDARAAVDRLLSRPDVAKVIIARLRKVAASWVHLKQLAQETFFEGMTESSGAFCEECGGEVICKLCGHAHLTPAVGLPERLDAASKVVGALVKLDGKSLEEQAAKADLPASEVVKNVLGRAAKEKVALSSAPLVTPAKDSNH